MVLVLGRTASCVASPLRPAREPHPYPPHDAEELSHYSSATSDIEYLFPIGWSELEGIAHRGDFDLTAHTEASGTGPSGSTARSATPHVVEPALGVNRSMLAFMVDAYDEEVVAGERTVLRLHPALAPVKVAVLPLIAKNIDDMVGKARTLYEELRRAVVAEYDDSGQIGLPLSPPGRDRDPNADRRPDPRGRHGRHPRPRLARPGENPDLRRTSVRAGQARHGLDDTEAGLDAASLEHAVARLRESELAVQVVGVGSVQGTT